MVIYNPAAGPRDAGGELREALRSLELRGWELTWRRTYGRLDAVAFAREAAEKGYDVAVAAGGDGTIGQVVNGIVGSQTALGVIPVGTTNVWAREMGIPLPTPLRPNALYEAADMLATGEIRSVDVGRVNDRYFLMWVGMGLDAEVTAQVEGRPVQKRRLGMLAFAIAALVQTLHLRGTKTFMELDGRPIERRTLLVVASNIQLYAGFFRIAPMACLTDGKLDVCVFQGYSGLSAYLHFFSVLLGLHTRLPQFTYYQAEHLVIQPERAQPVQVDGDVAGYTPVDIHVVPSALRVMVPAHIVSPSLREPADLHAPLPRHFYNSIS